MENDPARSRSARKAAETALVRVIHHYGSRPEFVVLGGLVPELICAGSQFRHAGTTDIDVQVDLEIACGAVNTKRLERALLNAEFTPTSGRVWRWEAKGKPRTIVKFELLADLDTVAAGETLSFDGCAQLGAVNLRGTGFAARDITVKELRGKVGDSRYVVEVNITGIAGFLLAKTAAAFSRRKPKDWYDIAYVLQHNDEGGPLAAAASVSQKFGADLAGPISTALVDLVANFQEPNCQGPDAYATQMLLDHPELDRVTLLADAVLAVEQFAGALRRA